MSRAIDVCKIAGTSLEILWNIDEFPITKVAMHTLMATNVTCHCGTVSGVTQGNFWQHSQNRCLGKHLQRIKLYKQPQLRLYTLPCD